MKRAASLGCCSILLTLAACTAGPAVEPAPTDRAGAEPRESIVHDPRSVACNDQFVGPTRIAVSFEMAPGKRYWDYLPEMGRSPELDDVDGAYVVIYAGPQELRYPTGQPGVEQSPVLENVVCIVPPGGDPAVYHNVSRQGMTVP